MRIIVGLLLIWLPISLLEGGTAGIKDTRHRQHNLERQKYLMAKVSEYNHKEPVGKYKGYLDEILRSYQKEGNREQTFAFYSSLLDSIKYKRLYAHIFYCMSEFYTKKMKEHYLLKSLKSSLTSHDRKRAWHGLYEYYRDKKIGYLQLSCLMKLIEEQKINRDYAALGNSYHELASFYRKKKDYLFALNYYFTALEYSERVQNDQRGDIYLNIAEVFRVLNRRQLTKKYLQKAMAHAAEHKNDSLKTFVLRAYSGLAYEEGDYASALKFINQSIRIEKEIKGSSRAVGSHYRKALILEEIGKLDEALELLKGEVETGLKTRSYTSLLPILSKYIERLIECRRFPEAGRYLAKVDDIYAPYYPLYFLYYYLKAFYYERKGNDLSALNYYRKTMKKLADYFASLEDHRYHSSRKKIDEIYSKAVEFYLKMYKQTGHKIYFKKALYYSEVQNAYTYELTSQKTQKYPHFQKEKEKLEEELSNNRGHRLEALIKEYQELNEFILEMPIKYKSYPFKDFNLAAVQQRLSPAQLIIKFILLKENAYVLFMDNRSSGFKKLRVKSGEILDKINQLTEPLDDLTRGQVDYLRIHYNLDLAHHLYRILLQEILAQYQDKDEIFVIPDRELFKLPFEALVSGFNQKGFLQDVIFSEYRLANYLIEKYSLTYCFSLFHFQKRFANQDREKYTIAAFGHPIIEDKVQERFDVSRGDLKWFNQIPSAKEELLDIGRIFGKKESRVFPGNEFNKKNFGLYAPGAKIIHIATHFINNIHYPQYSALVFSPLKNKSPFYYAHEIFKLELNSELVVLSACESSEKQLLGVQGLRGMTASFRHAGVKSMLVSMWPVDEMSSRIIPEFYQEYHTTQAKNNPGHISQALRKAKLKLMKKTTTLQQGVKFSFAHPFLWANFILYDFYF